MPSAEAVESVVFDGYTPVIAGTIPKLTEWANQQGHDWGQCPWEIWASDGKRLQVRQIETRPDGSRGVQFYSPSRFVEVKHETLPT